jgi:hypothetical protein
VNTASALRGRKRGATPNVTRVKFGPGGIAHSHTGNRAPSTLPGVDGALLLELKGRTLTLLRSFALLDWHDKGFNKHGKFEHPQAINVIDQHSLPTIDSFERDVQRLR